MKTRQLIVLILVILMFVAGCSSFAPAPTPEPTPTPVPTMSPEEVAAEQARIEAELEAQKQLEKENRAKDLKIVLLIPGNLVDQPYYSLAYEGLENINAEYGSTISYVEMGKSTKSWEKNFMAVLEEDWDFVIALSDFSGTMSNLVYLNAEVYPDTHFILFESSSDSTPSNVMTINFKTNEATFLAGACAALVTSSKMGLANEQPLIGFVGGMNIYTIRNLFLLGYIEGAKYINNDIKIMVSYSGTFSSKKTGERQATTQYSQGVDVIFQAAGQTGYGVINGALAADQYVIGVDIDQALELEEKYPEKAAHILTSIVKQYDGAIFWAIDQYAADELAFGTGYNLGISENAVGIAKNSYYDQIDSEIRAQLEDIEAKIVSKEINLDNLESMDNAAFDELVKSVEP